MHIGLGFISVKYYHCLHVIREMVKPSSDLLSNTAHTDLKRDFSWILSVNR